MSESTTKPLSVAGFGFRSIPPSDGAAGADKFALELYPRLVEKGCRVTAYNRAYPGQPTADGSYEGVTLVSLATTQAKGFDTLLHSFKATFHIITKGTGDVVHIQNGGNSIWALFLRLAGKRVYVSQDGVDWKRDKWPWYGKLYLFLSSFITAHIPNRVIFDNVFARKEFEERFSRKFDFIPFGSETNTDADASDILEKLGLEAGEYILFVGRFIPDKGLQYLIPAFEKTVTDKKLVLVGGSPNPSPFEASLRATKDDRILFPGFIYGQDTHALMKNAYAYVQPSDVEGLSPVILETMSFATPVICSDIPENMYIVEDCAITFRKGSIEDAARALRDALADSTQLAEMGRRGRERATSAFSWDAVTDQHIELFRQG